MIKKHKMMKQWFTRHRISGTEAGPEVSEGSLKLPWLPALREFPGLGTGRRRPGGAQGGLRAEEEELRFQETRGP